MLLHGVATAITGDLRSASFHCNTLRLDTEQTKARTDKDPSKNIPRLVRDGHFEAIRELSFTEKNINLENEEEVQKVAKRFWKVLTGVVKMQVESGSTQAIPLIIGEDGRKNTKDSHYYPRKNLQRIFLQAEPDHSKLLSKCLMHSGIFARRSPGAKPQVQSEEDDLFTKEGIQWRQAFLDNQDPNEADDRSSFLTDLVNFAKHDAIKMAYHFVESIQGTNRFLGFDLEPYRFAYLSLDPSIERAFNDQLCSISSIHRKEGQVVPPPHALAIKIDAEPAPPFLDVVKTLLLDQFSATEDKLDRITKKYHDFFKLRIKQMTKPPSSV